MALTTGCVANEDNKSTQQGYQDTWEDDDEPPADPPGWFQGGSPTQPEPPADPPGIDTSDPQPHKEAAAESNASSEPMSDVRIMANIARNFSNDRKWVSFAQQLRSKEDTIQTRYVVDAV